MELVAVHARDCEIPRPENRARYRVGGLAALTREARRSNSLLNKLLLLFLALTAVAIAATALSAAINWSPWTGTASRWMALATLIAYASVRRSLTTWIFVSMLVGGELGHDFPALAAPGRLLSQIFLRLIKTIIAPLIFSTLVVGIASHTNLKQVGRMGIKALIYFEVVTTLALFIGLAAINLTQAGAGVQQLQTSAQAPSAPAK